MPSRLNSRTNLYITLTIIYFQTFRTIEIYCATILTHRFTRFYRATAMLSAVYAVVECLCVCVCVSVTLRYCIKTAKHRITQTTPHDSPITLVPTIMAKFERDHPLWGRQMQVGWVKIGHFRRKTRYNSKTVQDRRIVSIKVVE